VVDYYHRPKHAYFAIKRELELYTIGIKRVRVEEKRDRHTRVYIDVEERIQVWIGTFNTCALKGAKVVVKAWDMGGRKLVQETLCEDITLKGNRSMEVADVRLPGWSGVFEGERDVVVAAYLTDKDGTVLARRVSWAEPLKQVFPHPRSRPMRPS
jgi:beta-mannosidase